MNLLHHLVVSELIFEKLRLKARLRPAMLLGAIAPDAHTEINGIDRTMLHPEQGTDPVGFVLDRLEPRSCIEDGAGRAFAISCIGHLVADEMTRENGYHLPPHAPSGFQPLEGRPRAEDRLQIIEAGPLVRDLMRATMPCSLPPVSFDAVDSKRWEVLGRYPFSEREGSFLVVEPLASVARECTAETLTRIVASPRGRKLIGA